MNWDARYNLERAQRLVPEPEQSDDAPPSSSATPSARPRPCGAYAPGLP
jgi:mxaK protein